LLSPFVKAVIWSTYFLRCSTIILVIENTLSLQHKLSLNIVREQTLCLKSLPMYQSSASFLLAKEGNDCSYKKVINWS
jgi:hypothetical protein